ncbi:MAG: hypothetical protein AAFV95_00200 [Bacteroidota bacterium]
MAQPQLKKSTAPPTATSTLAAFEKDLQKILMGLQTKINSNASDEAKALNTFIQAESTLISKSTDFGGPSPYFISPTWEGSKTPNGSKSYKKSFEPIIKRVLSEKTAGQDISEENQLQLVQNLINIFKVVYTRMDIANAKDPFDTTLLLKFVGDSIFESATYLSIQDQEGLFNQMTANIVAKKGLPTDKTFDGSNKAFKPWLTKEITTYLDTISKDGPDIDKMTQRVLSLLHSTLSKYKPDEDSIREWVHDTIVNAPKSVGLTNLQKEELVGALEQEVTLLFPQPDASFFFSNIQTILLQNINNPPVTTTMSKRIIGTPPPRPLTVMVTNVNTGSNKGSLTAVASGGTPPVANQYTYAWSKIDGSTSTPITENTATINNLSPGTYQVIVSDGTNTATSSKVEVYKSTLSLQLENQTNPTLYGLSDGKATVEASGGKTPYTFTWTNVDSKAVLSNNDKNTPKDTVSAAGAGTYSVVVKDNSNAEATILVTFQEPPYSQNNGIKYVIDTILDVKHDDKNPMTSKDKKILSAKLDNALKQVIKISISKTFDDLPEYGSQGRLLSSTYDYQLVSRLSDYTTGLINEMKNDFNSFIPTNSSNALKSAQEITAAAVAFRNLAISLPAIEEAFDSEGNHITGKGKNIKAGQPGYNYNQVYNLIFNYPNKELKTLKMLANAAYMSTGKKVPLVKKAEYEGVTLASSTAGLNTSLSKLLTGEQSTALNSLSNMKNKAKANFNAAYKDFDKTAQAYFSEMDSYIEANQDFNFDMLKLDAVQNALDTLNKVIEKGITHGGGTNVYADAFSG